MIVGIILFALAVISIVLGFFLKKFNFIFFIVAIASFVSSLIVLYYQQVNLIYLLIASLFLGVLVLLLTIIKGGKREL